MSEEELKPHLNPHSLLTDPVDVFDVVAIPLPPGTKAPPRPQGKERKPGQEWPVTEPFETFECQAIPLPPGTPAPPRPPGRERSQVFRVAVPETNPAAEVVAELLRRVQGVVDTLAADPAGLESLRQAAAALSKAR